MTHNMPEGFVHEDQIIYGMRKEYPGLFEIKIHNPKIKNAIGATPEAKLTKLIKEAQEDEDIKVILLHGGAFFSSGNDLGAFAKAFKTGDVEKMLEDATHGAKVIMVDMLLALATSIKPIVAVVRGGSVGIAFTLLSHATFIYCSPDAYFKTPFMESGQSPEGTSTLLFPDQFGRRKANEILMLDKVIPAKEAVASGFANGIIDKFDKNSEWFDPGVIPCIPKLLKTDYRTLTNSMQELNHSKDMKKIEDVTRREAQALLDTWQDPTFIANMTRYLKSTVQKKKKKMAKL